MSISVQALLSLVAFIGTGIISMSQLIVLCLIDTEELVNGALPLHKKAIFPYISYEHRLTLVQCLMESHKFAKTFNSNMEQRNILWEAGMLN